MKGLPFLLAAGICLAASAPLVAAGKASSTVSFKRDVQPIFAARCAMCHHAEDPVAGLSLAPEFAYDQLVGVQSVEVPSMQRVAPWRTGQSYLIHKIDNSHLDVGGRGWSMPPAINPLSRLSNREKECIRAWVRQGARRN